MINLQAITFIFKKNIPSLKIIVDNLIILCYNVFEVKGRHKVLNRNEKNSFMEKQGRNES